MSIPVVVWGSTLILKWVDRFPVIITIGAAVLAYTAAKMIVDEKWFAGFFESNPFIKWAFIMYYHHRCGILRKDETKTKDGTM
ncbi:hypothetical protein AAHB65_04215 [Bacillus toyonensis]